MESLKVSDVRLRGCYFTLMIASEEANVSPQLMHSILCAIYCKAEILSDEEMLKHDPYMAREFTSEDFSQAIIDACIETGLLIQDGNDYKLTEKSISILYAAAEKQKKLDKEDFSYCPCHCYCG